MVLTNDEHQFQLLNVILFHYIMSLDFFHQPICSNYMVHHQNLHRFGDQGLGLVVQCLWFGFRVQGLGCVDQGLGFSFWVYGVFIEKFILADSKYKVKLGQVIIIQIGAQHGLCVFRLLTPPGTPLFPSLEMESRKTVMSRLGTPTTRPVALKSRVSIFNEAFRPCKLFYWQ